MSVQKDPSGQRSVQVEVEVPGSPEEVWEKIATGPGVSSWFVPTEIDGKVGGDIVTHFGPGNSMDSHATVTSWEPPHRMIAENSYQPGDEEGKMATEWTVEAKAGGTCTVRVVHRWFTETDSWDNQMEQAEHGWGGFFQTLKLGLTHFPGQPGATAQAMAMVPGPVEEAWRTFRSKIGFGDLVVGQPFGSQSPAPLLSGTVAQAGDAQGIPYLRGVLEQPAPGIAHIFMTPMGDQVYLALQLYFFGDGAARTAAEQEQAWTAWLSQTFPGG